MHKLSFLILCILLFNNCTKNSDQPLDHLVGTWQLVGTSGGITGHGFDANYDRMIVNEKFQFQIFENDNLLAEGKLKERRSSTEDLQVFFDNTFELSHLWESEFGFGEQVVRFHDFDFISMTWPPICNDCFDTSWKRE